MKKFGFTLSEVMITLGIIGVVAALTIPVLVKNYQKTVYVTSLHKVYNEIDGAIKQYMTDQHVDDLRESDLYANSDGIEEFIKSYFKVTKDCGDLYNGCFADAYYSLSGVETSLDPYDGDIAVTIADGMSLSAECQNNAIKFEVDVNGMQPPNIFGRDMFEVYAASDGSILDMNYNEDDNEITTENGNATGAFGKIMNDGWKMNY